MRYGVLSLAAIAAIAIGFLRTDFEKIDRIDWPDIERSDFSMNSVPKWLLDMQGQPVRMRGAGYCGGIPQREFLFAPETSDGKFVHWSANWDLVPVHYAIHVTLVDDHELSPNDRVFEEMQVQGVFRIEPVYDSNDQLMMLYHIDQATVIASGITPGYSASRGWGC